MSLYEIRGKFVPRDAMGGKIFTRTPANYIMVSALARGYTWMSFTTQLAGVLILSYRGLQVGCHLQNAQ